jgi:hypothetical protein
MNVTAESGASIFRVDDAYRSDWRRKCVDKHGRQEM